MPDAAAGAGHAAGHGSPRCGGHPYDKTITFTGVAKGDTVKAYQLMKYDANYNEYIFYREFETFAANFYDSKTQSLEEHLAESTKEHLTALMINYAIMTDSAHGGVSFPKTRWKRLPMQIMRLR